MPAPLVDLAPIRAALAAGELVLTPNQRLARAIEQTWGQELAATGTLVWERPRAYALEHWFERMWQELRDAAFAPALAGTVASAAVETRLWARVIAAHPDSVAGNPQGFARLARSARQLLERWDLDPARLDADGHRGAELLLAWLPAWRKAMTACALLTREQSLDVLPAGMAAGLLAREPAIHLLGFATLPPRYRRILTGLGARVIELRPQGVDASPRLAALPDPAAEIAAAAGWARDQLQADPQRRIGVIFPDLTANRARIERQFRDLLAPDHGLPDSGWQPPPFNLSAGVPLAELPLPRAALELLALADGPAPLGLHCALLQDPFWSDAETELEVRSRAERQLWDLNRLAPSAGDFRHALARAEAAPENPVGSLSRRVQAASEHRRRAPARQGFAAWARHASEHLDILGWPGSRSLDSHEYQQRQHWRTLLDDFTALAVTGETPNWSEALTELRRLAADTVFQPRTPEAPLQILGVLEAAGLRFDALWVAGMSDARWPESLAPHPLLPGPLQRRLAMPRAQGAHELALARTLVTDLAGAAPAVIFSYPLRDGEVALQAFAPLRQLPSQVVPVPALDQPLAVAQVGTGVLETIAWGDAPACVAAELVRGGSGLLRDQAACPFNAFAIWRLGARALPEPEPGLTRAERGTLVHRALELCWRELPDQMALLALSPAARAEHLAAAIDGALDELARQRPELRGGRPRAVESACLHRLLAHWLMLETLRPPFQVVAREQDVELDLAGLPIRLRIDRIDRLADGRLLLIDYKTGNVRAGGWVGARPEEPQLPLYALAVAGSPAEFSADLSANTLTGSPLAGIAFARVRIDDKASGALLGISDVAELIPGCKTLAEYGLPADWPAALAQWRHDLGALAQEFLHGTATIACHTRAVDNQTELLPLNRLPEQDAIQRWRERT